MACVVYWLFDANCVCPWKHGYVGVTINLRGRLKWHRAKKKRSFEHRILFEGSEQECFELEARMRPDPFIGWNRAFGGEGGCRQPRSIDTRQKMREAALRRYADPVERTKMSEIFKGRKITWGAKVAASKRGTKLSDLTRARMSAVRKGRQRGPFSEEHCANISRGKIGKSNPAIAESNRRRRGIKRPPRSAEHCAKIAAAKKNISKETRAKMSMAAKARCLRQQNAQRSETCLLD